MVRRATFTWEWTWASIQMRQRGGPTGKAVTSRQQLSTVVCQAQHAPHTAPVCPEIRRQGDDVVVILLPYLHCDRAVVVLLWFVGVHVYLAHLECPAVHAGLNTKLLLGLGVAASEP